MQGQVPFEWHRCSRAERYLTLGMGAMLQGPATNHDRFLRRLQKLHIRAF